MDKSAMMQLLDRGNDGNSILQILDVLCFGMDTCSDHENDDTVDDLVDETDEIVMNDFDETVETVENLVETSKKPRKSKKDLVEV